MPFLTATQAAAAAGLTVRQAVLVYFDFVGDPRGYWLGGFGPLVTADPLAMADKRTWDGDGGLGSVDGLDVPVGTSAPVATFTMSGVDARIAALARAQSATVKGQLVQVFVQFYKDDLTLLDAPVAAWTGILDVMTYRGLGGGKFSVSVTAETEWASRNKPPYGYLTDTDQQARFPGDRGLELVASLPGKAINWPT